MALFLYEVFNPPGSQPRTIYAGNERGAVIVEPDATVRAKLHPHNALLLARRDGLVITAVNASEQPAEQVRPVVPARRMVPPNQFRTPVDRMPRPAVRAAARPVAPTRLPYQPRPVRETYDWLVAVPAWGPRHLETFERYVVPAIVKALPGISGAVRFMVHTDKPDVVGRAMPPGIRYITPPLSPERNPHLQAGRCNRAALAEARVDEVVAFINGDMVPSVELFSAAEKRLKEGKQLVMMAGTRTLAGPPVPVGATSAELLRWAWAHQHPWITENIWPTGRSNIPSVMFFQKDGTVVQRGFHLHPFAVIKSDSLSFSGPTIDSDLGSAIPHDLVHVVTDKDEMSFAEISPIERDLGVQKTANDVDRIANWASRAASDFHRWLYTHRIVIQGDPDVDVGDDSIASDILERVARKTPALARPAPMPPSIAVTRPELVKATIAIPAWGERCLDLATKYAVPSVLAALDGRPAQFMVYTDQPGRFVGLQGVSFQPVPKATTSFKSLTASQLGTWEKAAPGSIVLLLNADVVVSREVFAVAEQKFADRYRVIATTGVRTLAGKSEPPIGASARELLAWAWTNRHMVIENSVWGRGRTLFPVAVYFEKDGNVVAHSSHLHPFLLLKDRRRLRCAGTIDDDLLKHYQDSEIFYPHEAEVGFAELSPATIGEHFMGVGQPISQDLVTGFSKDFMVTHVRNFRAPLRIIGDGDAGDEVAYKIADKMIGNH